MGSRAARDGLDFPALLLDGGLGGADIGAVLAGQRLNRAEDGQRPGGIQVVDHREILAEIGKQQDRETDAGLVQPELRFLGVALALRRPGSRALTTSECATSPPRSCFAVISRNCSRLALGSAGRWRSLRVAETMA